MSLEKPKRRPAQSTALAEQTQPGKEGGERSPSAPSDVFAKNPGYKEI